MRLPLALVAFLSIASRAWSAQEFDWVETRFHRIHLRNGNFIDGQLTDQSAIQVSVKMKAGDLIIKNDQVDWIELVKMRSLNERPKPIPKIPEKSSPSAAKAKEVSTGRVSLSLSPEALSIKPAVLDLVERYRASAQERRRAVVADIAKAGPEAANVLASQLEETEGENHAVLLEIMGLLRDRRAVPSLVKLLSAKSPALRAEVADLLGLAGDDSAAGPLRALLRDPDAEVRKSALSALNLLDDRGGLDVIAGACADLDRAVRGKAAAVSLELGRKFECLDQVCRWLCGLVDRSDPPVRADLVRVIGLTRSREGVPTLVSAVSDPESAVRALAVSALVTSGDGAARKTVLERLPLERECSPRIQLAIGAGKLKLMDSIDTMIVWLREDDKDLQAAVGNSLKILTGQDFGADPDKWLTWWRGAHRSK